MSKEMREEKQREMRININELSEKYQEFKTKSTSKKHSPISRVERVATKMAHTLRGGPSKNAREIFAAGGF